MKRSTLFFLRVSFVAVNVIAALLVIPTAHADDFDDLFGYETTERVEPAETPSESQQTSPTPSKPTQPGLPIHLPLLGSYTMLPFIDPATEEVGYKITFADSSKKVEFGALVIDDGEIEMLDNKTKITGRATIFDKQARFGLKDIDMGGKGEKVKKIVLGVQFTTQPSFELFKGATVTLTDADIEIERDKPVGLVATVQLLGQSVRMAMTLDERSVNGYIELPPATKLSKLIPAVTNVPPLAGGVIERARLELNNIWSKTSEGVTQPFQVIVQGDVAFATQELVGTITSTQPTTAPTETPTDAISEDDDFNLLIDVGGTQTVAPYADAADAAQIVQVADDRSVFSMRAVMFTHGVDATLATQKLYIPSIGTINNAKILINTVGTRPVMTLTGAVAFMISDAGTLDVDVSSAITSKGIAFAGKVNKEFNYAGISLKDFAVSFDTANGAAALDGNVFIPSPANLTLDGHLLLLPDPAKRGQKMIKFTTKTSSQEFKPFSGVPGLETFYVKDFDAGLEVNKIGGIITKAFYLNGDFYVAGVPLKSIVKFVENAQGEKGVFVNAPLTKDKKLSDFFGGLGGPFDGIMFNQAMFVASSINFLDINEQTKTQLEVTKGLTFLAEVPLKGTLEPIGEFLGSTDQTFTMSGKIYPDSIENSELGFILSAGIPQPDKVVSIGETKVYISASLGFGVSTNIQFRPTPEELLKFMGTVEFLPKALPPKAKLTTSMQGAWNNPFGLPKSKLSDVVLEVGTNATAPGVPTSLGGGGNFEIGDFKAKVYFEADADLKDCAIKGEVSEVLTLTQLIQRVLVSAFDVNLGPLKLPDPEFKNVVLEAAAKDIFVGTELIRQGLAFKADFSILNSPAHVDILVRKPSLTGGGLKIFGVVDPINVGGVLKITKSANEYGGRCFVPDKVKACVVSDKQELKLEGEQFALEEDAPEKPRVDIELTLQRQNFLISGAINIADLFVSDACMSIDNSGMKFMLEAALQSGGEPFLVDGNPLFMARVVGQATGGFTQTPTFSFNIDFMQQLQKYLRNKSLEAFNTAERAVIDGIATAKNEIDTMRAIDKSAAEKIAEASAQVASAQSALADIDEAIAAVQESIQDARDQVNSLRKKREQLEREFDAMPALAC